MKALFTTGMVALAIMLGACQNDGLLNENLQQSESITKKNQLTKEEAELEFSKTLSKACYAEPQLRSFLKDVALEENDNDHNIFYPLAKDRIVKEGKTFEEILKEYAKNPDNISAIENAAPLLNIFIPDLSLFQDSLSVENLNPKDANIPVYYQGKFYVDGNVTDSVSQETRGLLPLFHTFVVSDSHRMKLKEGLTRAINNDSYTFADDAYNPAKTPIYGASTRSRRVRHYELYEIYNQLFDANDNTIETSLLPKETLKAYNQVGNGDGAIRTGMAYRLNSLTEFNTKKRDLDLSVKDAVFRMKVNPNLYYLISRHKEQVATNGAFLSPYILPGSYYNEGGDPGYEEVFPLLWSDGKFTFRINVVTGNNVSNIVFAISPKDLFTTTMHLERKHRTFFRKSHAWYSINAAELRAKWIYPHYLGIDLRFDSWNPFEQTLQRAIYVSVLGSNAKNTHEYSYVNTYMTRFKAGFDGSASFPITKDGKGTASIRLSAEWEKQHTIQQTDRIQMEVTDNEISTGNHSYYFFGPSAIERIEGSKAYLTTELFGCFDMCILPVNRSLINR